MAAASWPIISPKKSGESFRRILSRLAVRDATRAWRSPLSMRLKKLATYFGEGSGEPSVRACPVGAFSNDPETLLRLGSICSSKSSYFIATVTFPRGLFFFQVRFILKFASPRLWDDARFLRSSSRQLERRLGQEACAQALTELVRGMPSRRLLLRHFPSQLKRSFLASGAQFAEGATGMTGRGLSASVPLPREESHPFQVGVEVFARLGLGGSL